MRHLLAVCLALTACATDEATDLSPDDGFDDTEIDGGKADTAQASRRIVHTFSDRKLYPEGGAFDPTDRSFYVGSLQHGSITRVDGSGTESTFLAGGEADRFTLGMQVDAARDGAWRRRRSAAHRYP